METTTEESYTILLYGETGAGKSTFINACENYIKYPTLAKALESNQIYCRVPMKFAWQNEDYEDVMVEYGADVNENLSEVGVSSTQHLRIHHYVFQDKLYRFIDTPGFNNTRGHEAELDNLKELMNFMEKYLGRLHAICIVLRSDTSSKSLRIRRGLKQFLKLFYPSMYRNLIFLCTHSKVTDYRPISDKALRNIIDDVRNDFENISIPYRQNKVFSMDNDPFRYLLAVKLQKESSTDQDIYSMDWSNSANTCCQLLKYIQTLNFQSVKDILRLNNPILQLNNLDCNPLLGIKENLNEVESETSQCMEEEPYTVLLYGETGVGKSTFINACENYLKFPTLAKALESDQIYCRVPMKFTWQNEDYEDIMVEYGADINENLSEIGVSSTQNLKIHNFFFEKKLYRFIDTPGFNDTRGYEVELENVKGMMEFMSKHVRCLHAICILLKPNESRESLRFRYGIMQFLSLFHRNMCGNIIFLYTHSKGTDYRLNTTNCILRNIIDEIQNNFKNINILYDQKNVFLMDNDGFRYFLAVKVQKDSAESQDIYSVDWSKSANTCFQLLKYIQTLDFRKIEHTLRLNNSRFKLEHLYSYWFLAIKDLGSVKKERKECLEEAKKSEELIEELTKSLYYPVVTVREGPYHLICANRHCSKKSVYSINGKACCPNCNSWAKAFCAANVYGVCYYCGCSMNNHTYLNKTGFRELEMKTNLDSQNRIIEEKKILCGYNDKKILLTDKIKMLQEKYEDVGKYISWEIKFLKDYGILSYHKECIETIRMEINQREEGCKKKSLENHLERYKSLYSLFQNDNYEN